MATQSAAATAGNAEQLQEHLRAAVMRELANRDLDDPVALAERLDVLPIAASGLLRRNAWTVETALWLVAKLDLPIHVSVTRRSQDFQGAARSEGLLAD